MSVADIHLKQDGIKEALFEIRFDTPIVPEVVIGRLTDADAWADFAPKRMPSADIPQQLRLANENLRFVPSYELTRADELIRIGPNMLSYHRMAPYPGWAEFFPSLKKVVETLFSKLPEIQPIRMGFRYINALNGKEHLISSASDLALSVIAGDGDGIRPESFALNYRRQTTPTHVEQIQVATPDYVQMQGPTTEYSVMVDIDIFSPDNCKIVDASEVLAWTEIAHGLLKENFFKLIPVGIIEQLRVK